MVNGGPRGRGMGRGMLAFVVADVVLVLALLVLVGVWVAGSSTSSTPDDGPGAAATVASSPSTSTGTAGTAPTTFRMPSGNIACTVSVDGVTCTIASIRFEAPAAAGCTGQTGHVFVLSTDGVTVPCVDGAPPAVAGDDVATLEYGSSMTVGGYTCTSATDGVTCTGADGIGFRLASGAWSQLP